MGAATVWALHRDECIRNQELLVHLDVGQDGYDWRVGTSNNNTQHSNLPVLSDNEAGELTFLLEG